jgi:hypothetical protein
LEFHTPKRASRALAGCLVAFLLLTNLRTYAGPQIVNLIDRPGNLNSFDVPVIDNNSVVYFNGRIKSTPAAPNGNRGIYAISGSALTPLMETPQSNQFGNLATNESGIVGFTLYEGSKQTVYRAGIGTTPTVVATNSNPNDSIYAGVVDHDGRVFFQANLGGKLGIFTGPDPVADKFVSEPTYIAPALQSARKDGAVLFRVVKPGNQGLAIYKGPNPSTDSVFDYGNSFYTFNNATDYAENSKGNRVFNAFMLNPSNPADQGFRAIFTGSDPVGDRLIDTNGPAKDLLDVALNELGTIVFQATLDDGRSGLFSGPDLLADKIIATGDTLFGSTVTEVAFDRGLNDSNQVAFSYALANGSRGIAMATVPEPAGVASIALGAAWGLKRRRRRASRHRR